MHKLLKIITGLSYLFITTLGIFYLFAFLTPISLDHKQNSMTIYDSNHEVIYETNFKKNSEWTNIEDIPQFVIDAVVSVEDKRFYQHHGFDIIRIMKALFSNVTKGYIVEGGSTITQQMAKNLFLSNEQTMKRKLEEVFYAARIEMHYDKQTILEAYLNTLYYGHGIYGIANASDFFFGKALDELNIAQVAMLVGIPNGPSLYSPFIDLERANQRKETICWMMLQQEVINEAEYQNALNEDLMLVEPQYEQNAQAYYIQAVIDEISAMGLNMEEGLNIYTYYDPRVQNILLESFHQHADYESECETSAMITQPYTGNILALQGGKDYTLSQYNRPLYSKRQFASTIKPLLYYLALINGFTPSSTFMSSPTTFQLDEKNAYTPTNYNEDYPNREISMINAIAMSDNIYAVKTHLFLGMETLRDALHAFGIQQAQANPSLALGGIDASLEELTRIYNTFASGGQYIKPALIDQIYSGDGHLIFKREPHTVKILQNNETLILNQMLRSTFDLRNRTVNFPTMYGYEPKVITAAKSGTSPYDSLVAGFNPDYTIVVWSGFDDARELDKSYYNIAKAIYQDTFNALYAEETVAPWYQLNDQLVEKKVDPISGEESLLGSTYWYLKE